MIHTLPDSRLLRLQQKPIREVGTASLRVITSSYCLEKPISVLWVAPVETPFKQTQYSILKRREDAKETRFLVSALLLPSVDSLLYVARLSYEVLLEGHLMLIAEGPSLISA